MTPPTKTRATLARIAQRPMEEDRMHTAVSTDRPTSLDPGESAGHLA